jgi:riboflavin synthase
MFTGLIEGLGVVRSLLPEGPGVRLIVAPGSSMNVSGTRIGDSVAINGCCLTVIATENETWSFLAGAETLSRTNLGELQPNDFVNLERSLPAAGRLGGHFVQGHVDGIGHVERIDQDGDWMTMWFRVPAVLTRQMVSKGSIAVDGVSLTLVDVNSERFSVALIPHSLEVTTLGRRKVGDPVNIETDIIGKYVEKLVGAVR